MSDEAPAVQAALLYDHSSGLYIGGFGSTVRLTPTSVSGFQGVGQVGYAVRGPGNLSYDVGALYTDFSKPGGLGYADVYVGAASSAWSVRLWHAPRYFGQSYSATYAEINLTPAIDGPWTPLVHFGWLTQPSGAEGGERSRWDARVGLAHNFELMTVQLSWVTASHVTSELYDQHRSRWVFKATAWLP